MTKSIQETATAPDMIQYLLNLWGLKNPNQLADHLGIDRRVVNQFGKRKGTDDFLCLVVKALSVDIEYLEKQNT